MYRRRLKMNPVSFVLIFIILIAYAIFSSVGSKNNYEDLNNGIAVIEETENTITIEFNQE